MAKRKARQAALPTLEDRAIRPLQEAGVEYADVLDERAELNRREKELKTKIRKLMRQHNKTHYKYEGVEIELVAPSGEEQVKVHVQKKDKNNETLH